MTWQSIKWGWLAVAGMAITGTILYVASPTQARILPEDVVELFLGCHERANMAGVTPAKYVRTFTSQGVTNIMTNALGPLIDASMFVTLDAKIKTLVPEFINPYSASNDAWTVTGLFAFLGIGNLTNQFTAVPAIGTNSATYGAFGPRMYKTNFIERYMAMAMMTNPVPDIVNVHPDETNITLWGESDVIGSFEEQVAEAEANSHISDLCGSEWEVDYWDDCQFRQGDHFVVTEKTTASGFNYASFVRNEFRQRITSSNFPRIEYGGKLYVSAVITNDPLSSYLGWWTNYYYDTYNDGIWTQGPTTFTWEVAAGSEVYTITWGDVDLGIPSPWPDDPTASEGKRVRGYRIDFSGHLTWESSTSTVWNLIYCTNRWW